MARHQPLTWQTAPSRKRPLGAITRGQRQTGGQGMFSSADNLEGVYARAALRRFFHALMGGRVKNCSLDTFQQMTGLSLFDVEGGIKDELPPITQFLNRMLALRIEMQNLLFEAFSSILDGIVDEAKASGSFDIGVETLCGEKFEIIERNPLYAHESGAEAIGLTIEQTKRTRIRSLADAETFARERKAKRLVNARSGRAALVTDTVSWTNDDGAVIARVKLTRPNGTDAMTLEAFQASEWKPVQDGAFEAAWAQEVDETPAFTKSTFTLVTGLLLPIWDALPTADMRVWRVNAVDAEGRPERVLGRAIEKDEMTSVLRRLGHEVEIAMTGEELEEALQMRRAVVTLADGATLRPARTMGGMRIELSGYDPSKLVAYKAMGCTTEIVSFRTRLYVPWNGAATILARIVATNPISDLRKGG